ncbi:hypothetical protein [Mycobacterium sp. 1081908.1]|uniref:hypothetical protein n=1 Tax=Mycobacterium sp. 1081908.1 TaxID=1834066 RepID=UPI0008020E60|nr:hypothetical protein [Mycobacterium sp. 1081908.1]OBK43444.1 hypothetical protein A5655_16945 [Mycobacterium sp. 1081908.1]
MGQALSGLTPLDLTDVYRAALVQAVAALDAYVHDVVLDRAVEIVMGVRPGGSNTKVGLHFGAVSDLISAPNTLELQMRSKVLVNERLSMETFQKPDDIAKAFAMVGIGAIWSSAFGQSGAEPAKIALSVVVRRRNQIAHRCDMDPSAVSTYLALSDADASDAIDTVERTVTALDSLL